MVVKNTLDNGMWKDTGPNLHSLLQKSDSIDVYSPTTRPLRSAILNSVLPTTLQTPYSTILCCRKLYLCHEGCLLGSLWSVSPSF